MSTTHRSVAPHALRFDLGGKVYDVEPHGEVAIPEKFHAAVKSRGLPLVTHAEAEAKAMPKPQRVDAALVAEMQARIAEVEDIAAKAQKRADEAEAKLAEVEAATRDFTAKLRERLGIGPDESIFDALDVLLAPKGEAEPDATKADEKPTKKR